MPSTIGAAARSLKTRRGALKNLSGLDEWQASTQGFEMPRPRVALKLRESVKLALQARCCVLISTASVHRSGISVVLRYADSKYWHIAAVTSRIDDFEAQEDAIYDEFIIQLDNMLASERPESAAAGL